MPTKTITIDVEAYRRLKSVQNQNESFSQTIKRVVRNPISTQELAALFDEVGQSLPEEFYQGVESAIAWRANSLDKERANGLLGHNRYSRSTGPKRVAKKNRRSGKAKAA